MLKKVLVPLDGSQLSEFALEYARQILGAGAEIVLVSVVDMPVTQAYFVAEMPIISGTDSVEMTEKLRTTTRDYLKQRAEQLTEAGFKASTVVEIGYPEKVIVDVATKQSVDAIVMCTHGRSGLDRILFGSITQRVLNSMPCPVFVVPSKAPVKKDKITQEMKAALQY
jgi:nucleotide-binding universal stress UspA family protein